MKKTSYSTEIASAIENFLNEDGWHFMFDENNGSFVFSLSVAGKLKNISYMIRIKETGYIVYAISPIGVDKNDKKMMSNMAEFICRANYGLKTGNFEINMDSGEIQFKFYVPCDDAVPAYATIGNSIFCPAIMFDEYGPGIVDVIFNNVSGKDAVEKCEKQNETESDSVSGGLFDSEFTMTEDDAADELDICLTKHFGAFDDNESDCAFDNTDDGELHIFDLFKTEGGTCE